MSEQKTNQAKFFSKYWVFVISIIGLTILYVVNYFLGLSIDYATILFGGAYLMLGLSIWRIYQDHTSGIQAKAWVCFSVFAAVYSIGEIFWSLCEKQVSDSCSLAQTLWLIGYLPLITFAVLYIKPFVRMISKKNILVSTLMSIVILIPSIHYITQYEATSRDPEILTLYLYTISDAILIIPMVIGFCLFFGGRANFAWSLALFAILSMTIADFMFIAAKLNGSMFFDEWQNIFYVGEYALFSLGLYYKSKRHADKNTFHHQESLK